MIEKYSDNEFIKESIIELKRLSSGGKRVRGYLVKLGAMLFGKDDDSYIDLAAALEIFQTAILIHDDIIDEADKRRGLETINAKYKGHIGVSKAICIGDLGFFISYRIINNANISKELKDEIIKIYSKTLHNTVNGEIIDVELPLKDINYHKRMNDSIIYPISEQELYAFAQNVFKLTHFDYISPDYDTSFKYTIDSLINGYHINFTKDDIEKYAYNISRLAYEKVVEYNG